MSERTMQDFIDARKFALSATENANLAEERAKSARLAATRAHVAAGHGNVETALEAMLNSIDCLEQTAD